MNNDLPPALIPARKETGIKESTLLGLISPLGILPENAVKFSVFLRIMQILHNICDIVESQWKEEKWPPKTGLSQMRSAFHASFTVRFAR